ncbi:MAG: putative maltokinase [Oscillochloridaceae bacterium]|nr:putative maltokinase [Chloroflexaceae bacterium]MDW8389387.1 putative maltokinase [Oscillochloridaceae bacterium]
MRSEWPPLLAITAGSWDAIFSDGPRGALEQALPAFLRPQRWFGAKSRTITSATISDAALLPDAGDRAYLVLVAVQYAEGAPETYLVSMAYAAGQRALRLLGEARHAVIARLALTADGAPGVIFEPLLVDRDVARALLEVAVLGRRLRTINGGEVAGCPGPALPPARFENLAPRVVSAEQSNTSLIFGSALIMKIFRKVEPGINPDLEIGRYLTEYAFPYTPPTVGALEYLRGDEAPMSLGMVQGYVANEGDAWEYTLAVARRSYDQARARAELRLPEGLLTTSALLAAALESPTPPAEEVVGPYLAQAQRLGERTADLHLALAAGAEPAFAPEPFSISYQRALYASMHALTTQTFAGLRQVAPRLPAALRAQAEAVLALEAALLARFQRITATTIAALRTRVHGDFHLGQVLYTGADFMIIDFEGEPVRPISERRLKRSPLCDVAGMLRSFQYAAYATLFAQPDSEERAMMRRWADCWSFRAGAAYLGAYLRHAAGAPFIPAALADLEALLEVFMLEKLIYEIGYEMNNRPAWLSIPLSGVLHQVAA